MLINKEIKIQECFSSLPDYIHSLEILQGKGHWYSFANIVKACGKINILIINAVNTLGIEPYIHS